MTSRVGAVKDAEGVPGPGASNAIACVSWLSAPAAQARQVDGDAAQLCARRWASATGRDTADQRV